MQAISFFIISMIAVSTGAYVTQDGCPLNEEYLQCGSACVANCTNPVVSDVCTEECVNGCFCKAGYLRNDNGTCVTTDKCGGNSDKCGDDEEFKPCGTPCPGTCKEPNPQTCILSCSKGCFCKDGLVRDTDSGKCVALDECPAEQCFNENEVYDICNGHCEPTCEDQQPICSFVCSGGCVCAPGFLRNSTGECVTADMCGTNSSNNTISKHLQAINKLLEIKFL